MGEGFSHMAIFVLVHGAWGGSYGFHPQLAEVPVAAVQETSAPAQTVTQPDRWADLDSLQLELTPLEPERVLEAPQHPEPFASISQFALFISLILAIASVVEVATGRIAGKAARPRWPDRKALRGFDRGRRAQRAVSSWINIGTSPEWSNRR